MNTSHRTFEIIHVLVSMVVLTVLCAPALGASVRVNGFAMYYEIVGEGEPLVLLHGAPGSGVGMKTRYADLAKDFQLVIPDLRGFGRSPEPTGNLSPRQAASDVFALLDQLELERVKAYGGSYGGAVLLHMAIQQPGRVEAMVVGAVGSLMSEQGREIMRSMDMSEMPDPIRRAHIQGEDQLESLLVRLGRLADDYDEFNYDAQSLSTISARTLIVTGDRDEYNPARAALELYESIPRSYLWIVPNGPHAVLLMDPELHRFFRGVAMPFLKGEWEQ